MGIDKRTAIIGGGNMGEALCRSLLDAEVLTREWLCVADKRESQRALLETRHGVSTHAENASAVAGADVVIFAVKPQILGAVLDELRESLARDALLISVAAGVSTFAIERRLVEGARVIRAMPNVATLVRAGATGLAAGALASDDDLALARQIFESAGLVRVVDEVMMDAVCGLSGSGPAFIFVIIEALADAGVKVGLSRWDAHDLASQTVFGAAKLVIESKEHPGRLKDMVCSPGGTSIAAIHTLEAGGLRTTLINAVEVATRRSAELGAINDDR